MFARAKDVGATAAAAVALLGLAGQGRCGQTPYFRTGVNFRPEPAGLNGGLSGDAYALDSYLPSPYAVGYIPYPPSFGLIPGFYGGLDGNPYDYAYYAHFTSSPYFALGRPFNDPYGGYLRGAAKIITPPAGRYVPGAKEPKEPRRP
jgi:hypothetical protein